MKAPAPKYNKILPPVGNHLARLIEILYIGTEKSEQYGNESYKVRVKWELPNEKAVFKEGDQPKPFVVGKKMTLSMNSKSTLRPFVEGMLGVSLKDEEAFAFDVDDLLGKDCMVYVTIDEKGENTYVNVNNATPVPKGMVCPPPFNPLNILSYEKWNEDFFQKLPEFLRKEISATPEYRKMKGEPNVDVNDVPFD